MKRYVVTLTEDELAEVGQRVSPGRGAAHGLTHARILLKADRGPVNWRFTAEDARIKLKRLCPSINGRQGT